METTEKNCSNCKHLREEKEETFHGSEGKKVATKYYPKGCLQGHHGIYLKWSKTRSSEPLTCFETK